MYIELIMNYKFPVITNISQLEFLRNEPEFIFKEEHGHTIVFYAVAFDHTFPQIENDDVRNAIRRECRGITFDSETGVVVSRPYHKFFNLNERPETQHSVVDFDTEHMFLCKIDGSMTRPVIFDGDVHLFTKAGYSDVAKEAELHLTSNIKLFCKTLIELNKTPIFEYVAPTNQIVLFYKEPQLILTAIRDNVSGEYTRYNMIKSIMFAWHDIPYVSELEKYNIGIAIDNAKDVEDIEGYVVRFDSGHMLKVKVAWYVRMHHSVDLITEPRKLIKLIIGGGIDDIKPNLSQQLLDYVNGIEQKLEEKLELFTDAIDIQYWQIIEYAKAGGEYVDRKLFAKKAREMTNPDILFRMLDGSGSAYSYNLVCDVVLKACESRKKLETVRYIIGDAI